jgi:HD-GYP domain-containing protein (c-di-GMP phosphodiesterase class II)
MNAPFKVDLRMAALLGSLSHALDLVEGQPSGHCVRCCWIGVQIGQQIGLSDAELSDLYYTLLLKDIGCSSNAARICELFLTDDVTFKRDSKTVDPQSLPQAIRFILSHTGLKAGLAERFRAIFNVCRYSGDITRELIDTRCHRGADIARRMRFSDAVANGIENLDEHWNGKGHPVGHVGEDIPVASRIALLTQVIDVFQTAGGIPAAMREIRRRSGTWFDPRLVSAFEHIAARPAFWDMLRSNELEDMLFALEPAQHVIVLDEGYLDDIAAAFAQVIDAKTPYTSGHSERVTLFTDMIAQQLGLQDASRRRLKRAALLHDIGKLGVSNSVLDKPDKLDEAEWQVMRMHPVHSEAILSRAAAFADLARVGGGHHERLDGKGYPRGLKGDAIDLDTRIVTVADIFDALSADRPYRAAMPVPRALSIMSEMVDTAIDARCFEALTSALHALDLQPEPKAELVDA